MEKSKRVTVDEARSIVKNIGYSQVELSEIGRNNWVFLSENECISIPKESSKIEYAVRVAAMKYLSENGIPTINLIDYGNLNGREYIVTKRLDAYNLDLSKLSNIEQEKVHIQCGKLAHELHRLSVNGFGRLDDNLCGPYDSWRGFVYGFFDSALKRLHTTEFLKERFSKRLQKRFSTQEYLLDRSSESFLHGDYHLGNMLFYGIDLKALIDLDIVMGGDKHWDIGHYIRTFHGDRIKGKKAFFKGYGEVDEERSKFYAMLIWTRKIASQGESRPEALEESVAEMEKILR